MTEIFLFGTLCHAPLREIVAGCALSVRPAVLQGAEVRQRGGASMPVLQDRAGGRVEGLVTCAEGEALARLDYYAACFGCHRRPVTIEVDGTPRQVEVWCPEGTEQAGGDPWAPDLWAADWAALTQIAAEEVMQQRAGGAPPAEVAQRYWMICARAQSQLSAASWRRPGLVGVNPDREAVEVVAHRHPYTRFFTVEELSIRYRRFDGSRSGVQERAVFRVADAVTVLPYDPLRDRILLIEQIRLGALAHGDAHPWLLEPVAGMIDAGETPEAAARRETAEEAGLSLGALHHVGRYYPSPGGLAQVLTSYVGIADLPDDIARIGGHDAEGEDILSHLLDWDTALEVMAGGDMANAPLILSFQWLVMNRERLRASG